MAEAEAGPAVVVVVAVVEAAAEEEEDEAVPSRGSDEASTSIGEVVEVEVVVVAAVDAAAMEPVAEAAAVAEETEAAPARVFGTPLAAPDGASVGCGRAGLVWAELTCGWGG